MAAPHNAQDDPTDALDYGAAAAGSSGLLLQRIETLIAQQVDAGEGLQALLCSCRDLLNGMQHEHHASAQHAADEMQRIDAHHQAVLDRLRRERDDLAAELSTVRAEANKQARAHTKAATDLLAQVERERTARQAQMQEQVRENETLREQIKDLSEQISEALLARERVAAHVAGVEQRLEQVLIPVRERLDASRAEAVSLRRSLNDANKQIEALQILTRAPR